MLAHGDSLLFHPNSAGHHIFDLNLALIIVSTILISLRIIVRKFVVKAMGWDDLIAIVAWGLCVTLSALEMDTINYGTGAQMEDVPRQTMLQFLKRLSIMELVYFIASGAVRLSILAFLPRLSKNKIYRWCIYGLSVIVVVVSLTGFFFVLTECSQIPDVFNYDASWRQCKDKSEEQSMMLAHAIISIFVDCMLVALPLWVVTNHLKMGVKAIQILLVFSFGIFAVATGIVRLSIISTTDFSVNTTYKMLTVAAWTDAELHVGLWVGCFPALQPLLRQASLALGLRSQLDSRAPTSKRDTTVSTDTSNRKSVTNRWSRSSGYFWSIGGRPVREAGSGGGRVEIERGTSGVVEMRDLEKGGDGGLNREQTDISVDIDLGERPNTGWEAETGADANGQRQEA